RRMGRAGARAGLPVLCAGNLVLGGAGKTPTAMLLAGMLADMGERVFCLSRGYGGSRAGPLMVTEHDQAAQVGDEPLMLARVAPTVVARDRTAGAALAREHGATVIVMDDGLQNASLTKELTIAVVDGKRGIGNARVFPAGPLRAPLAAQLKRTDALLVVGEESGASDVIATARLRKLPVLHGRLVPDPAAVTELKGRKVLAFAGIGDPEKFFATAEKTGIAVAERLAFSDHHAFSAEEVAALIMEADENGFALLTTEKDRARMIGDTLTESLAARVHVLPVRMEVREMEELRKLVTASLGRHRPA
ncbi:MAG: tetraacyldisaccharide 4'-kinase, partial [Pseudolabrys sp.]